MSNQVITFHYKLTNVEGDVLDQSLGGEPLVFMSGIGHLIEGLEKELTQMSVGDKKVVNVAAAEAYGEREEQLVQQVERSQLPEDLEVGMQFSVGEENSPLIVTVIDFNDEEVTLDGNHPLAGEALTFDVELIAKRDATADEVAHGHVHGEGGHMH